MISNFTLKIVNLPPVEDDFKDFEDKLLLEFNALEIFFVRVYPKPIWQSALTYAEKEINLLEREIELRETHVNT